MKKLGPCMLKKHFKPHISCFFTIQVPVQEHS